MDYSYFLYFAAILVAVLSLVAQISVKSRFAKYDKVTSKRGITGAQAAAYLLKCNGITDVKIRKISGHLTDNFNPTNKILSLSESTFDSTSIAAIGVAAHETGHAIQHAKGYLPVKTRGALVVPANFGSRFGPLIAILGLALPGLVRNSQMESMYYWSEILIDVGLALFSASMVFYLVTLPVEFNASNRALKILKENKVMDKEELRDVRKVLGAAAMTYVAAALSSCITFLRFFLMAKGRRRR
ncbi:MAG: zinc metallopeptidase [Treponema sp.]|nr:zinc metallopeptidase [Treponema sp.]